MKRSYPSEYDRNNEPVILPKATIDLFLKNENESFFALITLYTFYYYTAKWQKTNCAYATINYVSEGTGLGRDKIRGTKKELLNLGLISEIQKKNEKGQITGCYIRVNFIFGEEKTRELIHPPKISHSGKKTTLLENHNVESQEGNALSSFNKNSLNSSKSLSITQKDFEKFWELYPRKDSKGSALKAWNNLCRSTNPNRPDFITIRKALRSHSRTKQWQSDKKHIPMPATWLNKLRWLDSAESIDAAWQQVQEINQKQSNAGKRPFNDFKIKLSEAENFTWNGDMKEYNINDIDSHPEALKRYLRKVYPNEYKG